LLETDPVRVIPIRLDITVDDSVRAATARCHDVNLLVNNAGIVRDVGVITAPDLEDARAQMDVNFWGMVRMCRSFAPVLGSNGGGAIVNILSNLALVHLPFQGFYCASKAAAWSATHGIRAQLRSQGTLVIAVLPDAIDTDMVAGIDCPKVSPASVAGAALNAVESAREDLFGPEVGDPMRWGERFYTDPKAVEREGAGLDALQPSS
jgi:NAD(P)-dependent dehydrogenase (short-subunit alcohol dehydrogenase family)